MLQMSSGHCPSTGKCSTSNSERKRWPRLPLAAGIEKVADVKSQRLRDLETLYGELAVDEQPPEDAISAACDPQLPKIDKLWEPIIDYNPATN